MEELNCIKSRINTDLKLIKIQYKGVKADKKLINIVDILREFITDGLIPEIEKFNLFDFNFFRQQISLDNSIREERVIDLFQEVQINEEIFNEFTNFINYAKQLMNRIENDYVLTSIDGFKLVYNCDICTIDQISRLLDEEKNRLNINDIEQMLIYCSGCIGTTIRHEVEQRRNDREEPAGLQVRIQQKIGNSGNVNKYINNIEIKLGAIFDISHELLMNEELKNKLKSNVSSQYKELIDRYIEIRNRINH